MNTSSEPAISEERLRQFFDAWNAHDVDAAMGFFADECMYLASFGPDDDGTVFRGRAAVAEGVRAFLSTFPNARYRDLGFLIVGSRAVAQWTFSGTRSDGKHVTYRGVDVFELDGGLITLKDAFRKERAEPLT